MKKLDFTKIKERIKGLYKNNRKIFFACIIMLALGLALLINSFFLSSKTTKKETTNKNLQVSVTDYASSLENKLVGILLEMESVTKASAFVMVESTPKIEYLTESENVTTTNSAGVSSSTISTTVVFEKNGSISTPVAVTTVMPKVTGVLIVINGVSSSTKYNIIRAISVVLNVDESSISILQES